MYLPLAALAVLGVLAARRVFMLAAPPTRPTAYGPRFALLAVSVALAVATIDRNREYASELSLVRTTVERWPTTASHDILGGELLAAGHSDEGMAELRAAIPGAPRARIDLGVELFKKGRLDEAIEQLKALIQISASPPAVHPSWQPPLADDVFRARTILGRAFAQQQRWQEAANAFRQAVAMNPSDAVAHDLLGRVLAVQGKRNEAAAEFERSLQLDPASTQAREDLRVSQSTPHP